MELYVSQVYFTTEVQNLRTSSRLVIVLLVQVQYKLVPPLKGCVIGLHDWVSCSEYHLFLAASYRGAMMYLTPKTQGVHSFFWRDIAILLVGDSNA